MRLLLDTHAFLWWLDDNPTLSANARSAIRNPENEVYVSAATAWEIAIKKKLGKLKAPAGLARELDSHNFAPLSISFEHALAVETLPDHHDDPFDRILVAQAIAEGLTLVTRDEIIHKYRVNILEA